MQRLTKIVARQDANFKLSPSSSNETSINLSNEISNLISDESGEVSFRIYKNDLVKATSILCLLPKVYMKKNTEPSIPYDILRDLSQQIKDQFGENQTAQYSINILKREDGRAYFNDLKKPNGFNIRSFLVEQLSEITFIKNDDGSLELRLKTLFPEDDIEQKSFDKSISCDLDQPLQLIYYGAPGTGKSFTIDQVTNENNSVRTTFHPDSDYASFVGAYKPTMAPMPINAFVGTTVHHTKNAENEKAYEKKIVYKYVPQAFLKAYVEAWKRYSAGEDNPYYLVIEEINRGNCAQIFGDLFQLLDRNNMGCSSYAISADEDIAQFLRDDVKGFALKKTKDGEGLTQQQRDVIASFKLEKDSGEVEEIGFDILDGSKLLLPPNLRIWATMNTSDQSLFPIDSAFKRRWNWEYMPIEYDPTEKSTGEKLAWKLETGGKFYSWGKFLDIINHEIEAITVSEDKQMGYFFAKPDKKSEEGIVKNDTISEKIFVNKVLFYLWTDVFKDYDLAKKPFIHEVKDKDGKAVNKPFSFRNFFPIENNPSLAELMVNLVEMGLSPLSEDSTQNPPDYNKNADGNFSVNGIPVRWQNGVPAEAVKEYIKAFPDKSASEVIRDWRSLDGQLVSHFIETQAENEARKDKDKTYVVSIDCNGDTIFVSKQGWGDNRPNGSYYALLNMVNAIKAKGWPIEINGVE